MKRIQTSIQGRESMKEDTREEGPRHSQWSQKVAAGEIRGNDEIIVC